MGYELCFKYKEEITKGEYSEEIKDKKVKVGDPWEEMPLETVAGKIMAQLARRNILIVDVEIYELKKNKLSYKETDDGIVIKNKKFRFDDGPAVPVGTDETSVLDAINNIDDDAVKSKLLKMLASNEKGTGTALAVVDRKKVASQGGANINLVQTPIRYEMFDPNPLDLAKTRHLALKPNHRYGILREETVGKEPFIKTYYYVRDDKGNEVKVVPEWFTASANNVLRFENEVNDPLTRSGRDPGINLPYGNTVDDVPDIRRR